MKTNSGRSKIVFFSNDVIDTLECLSRDTGRGVSWHVRQACAEYLGRNGFNMSGFVNPDGRGARSDLRTVSSASFQRAAKKARNQSLPGKSENS